jgi:kynurenine formamidase
MNVAKSRAKDSPLPSPFGLHDQLGMLNHITAQKVARAARLVKQGVTYDLSHVLDEHVPAFPGRTFKQTLDTTAHVLNRRRPDAGTNGWGENNVNWILEHVEATSQMGTHLDGLNHLQKSESCYNGYQFADIVEEWGTNKLGIETVPQIVTRGILIDVAKLHGVERLEPGYAISIRDVEQALVVANLQLEAGDAVFFHTGWSALWNKHEHYLAGEPGPGLELAHYLAEKGIALTGCDTWSYGPVPAENPKQPFIVPQTLNVDYGVFVVENLDTSSLARDSIYEFMCIVTHAKVRGATGAWVAPLALI